MCRFMNQFWNGKILNNMSEKLHMRLSAKYELNFDSKMKRK